MIVKFFKHGTGKSGNALRYLLGNDKDNKPRDPTPEIIAGDLNITRVMIDSNHRKHKYTSGVIAFRDNEKPTSEQLQKIINSFEQCFTPGSQRLPMLWILHQEKGNTEVHFLAPMQDSKTFKQCNISPPGEKMQQMFRDFQTLHNYRNNWQSIKENLFKSQMNELDKLMPEEPKQKLKKLLSTRVEELAKKGTLNNRDDLLKYLTEKHSFEVTRAGKDYISVKPPRATKAIRLKGPAFSVTADYSELLKQQAPIDSIEEKKRYKAAFSRFSSSVKNRLEGFKRALDNIPVDDDVPVDDGGGSSGGDIATTINIAINKEAIELHHEQLQPAADLPHFSNQRLKK
ncbi:relaxase/mobilization nuclease domain-containing protein [Comamonas jiangduensis]|uniref:relaxase/mobilization nuclease domain-containing protein n=1 Tax=Comamonas jiangduensis TaxID=1194168 RepID=UPI003BF817B2